MHAAGAVLTRTPDPLPSGPEARLAELVAHLTDCSGTAAVEAVRLAAPSGAPASNDDRLAAVAAALVLLKRGRAG
jgi:hypothetical protein